MMRDYEPLTEVLVYTPPDVMFRILAERNKARRWAIRMKARSERQIEFSDAVMALGKVSGLSFGQFNAVMRILYAVYGMERSRKPDQRERDMAAEA